MSERIPYAVPDAGVKNTSVAEGAPNLSVAAGAKDTSVAAGAKDTSVAGGIKPGSAIHNPPVHPDYSSIPYVHVRNARRSQE
jgi:hypothetical protein